MNPNVEEIPSQEEPSDDEDNLPLSILKIRLEKETIDRNTVISWKEKCLQLNEDQLRFSGDTQVAQNICWLVGLYEIFSY